METKAWRVCIVRKDGSVGATFLTHSARMMECYTKALRRGFCSFLIEELTA